jgi:hypothetical protein
MISWARLKPWGEGDDVAFSLEAGEELGTEGVEAGEVPGLEGVDVVLRQ